MLLKEVTSIKLEKQALKILCLSAAFNHTFVMVRMDKPSQVETIVHINAEGKILWEHSYNDIIDMFGMMTDREVIVLNVPESRIEILNLEKQSIRTVSFSFMFQDCAQMRIKNFSDTRLFCIKEQGTHADNRLRLTYFNYDDFKQGSQHAAQYTSKENEWTYDHVVKRANNHSKMCWWTYKHDQEIVFTYFDLRDDPKGKLSTVKCVNTLGADYGINNLSISIAGLWEIGVNKYMLMCMSTKSDHKEKGKNKEGIYNNNFVMDASAGNDHATIREAKFLFDKAEDGFCFNDQLIDFFPLGGISVFHTFRHNKGEALETPVYYIKNETEEIIAQQTWRCTCYAARYYFPGWDGNLLVQSYHENGDVEDIVVTCKKVMEPKEISLHFLLHLNEDFDDDLLQDAIELLH